MFAAFFPNQQQRAERQHLRDVITHCRKKLRHDHDLLSNQQEKAFSCEIQMARNALNAKAPGLARVTESLIDSFNRCFPQPGAGTLRENGDVILVAFVVAMAVKAFFFQPFKIPTGSMQPTLNGITVRASKPHEKTWWYRLVSLPLFGEHVIHFEARSDGMLSELKQVKYGPLHYGGGRGFLNFLPKDATEFRVGNEKYSLPMELNKFRSDVLGSGDDGSSPLLRYGRLFKKGDVILDCVVQTGDQLFVDRFTYNFRKPERGDIFVFETHDLPVSSPGEFYIKRLAGVPGDTLEIKDPDLYVNGEKIANPVGFQRVMSCENGYRGYTSKLSGQTHLTGPDDPYSLKAKECFALGDNSFSSQDSRMWGTVPYRNIVGRGFFVYWPFTHHFGRIE